MMARGRETKARRDLEKALLSKYWREADARVVVDAWRSSGESLAEFAKRRGLSSRRLRWWVRRMETGSASTSGDVLFFPLRLTGGAELAGRAEVWTLELGGGVSLKVPCSGGAELLATTLTAVKRGWTC